MYESGPFGEASGRPAPVAVETFQALKQRQTSDGAIAPAESSCAAGSTCSTGTATAPRTGCSPATTERRRSDVDEAAARTLERPRSSTRSPRWCLDYPDEELARPAAAARGRPWPSSRRAAAATRLSRCSTISATTPLRTPPARTTSTSSTCPASTRSTCPTGPTATPAAAARCSAGSSSATGASGFLVDTHGELPDYLPMVLEYAAIADPVDGPALLQEYRPSLELLRFALLDERHARTPASSTAVCATLPGASPADRAAVHGDGRRRAADARRSGWSRTTRGCCRCTGRERRDERPAVGRPPYVMLAVLVGGTIWRYRYDQFGWTTRSSQLYESRLLRIGSPLFHFGILSCIVGHIGGLVIPESWTEAVGVSEGLYHFNALLFGGIAGRLHPGRHRHPRSTAAARPGRCSWRRRKNDKRCTSCSSAAIVLGLWTTLRQRRRRTRGAQLPRDRLALVPLAVRAASPTSTRWPRPAGRSRSTPWSGCCCSPSGRSPGWCTPSPRRCTTCSGPTSSTAAGTTRAAPGAAPDPPRLGPGRHPRPRPRDHADPRRTPQLTPPRPSVPCLETRPDQEPRAGHARVRASRFWAWNMIAPLGVRYSSSSA